MRGTLRVRALLLILSVALAIACGGDSPGPTDLAGTRAPATLTVTPDSLRITVGAAAVLTATVADSTGRSLGAYPVTWSSRAPATASVDQSGRVSGLAPASTWVLAQAASLQDSAQVTVERPVLPVSSLVWSVEFPGEVKSESPAVSADGTLYVVAEAADSRALYALSEAGAVLWTGDVGEGRDRHRPASPIVDASGRILVAATFRDAQNFVQDQTVAFEPDGSVGWTLDRTYPFAATADGAAYLASSDSVFVRGPTGQITSLGPLETWDLPIAVLSDGSVVSHSAADVNVPADVRLLGPGGVEEWRHELSYYQAPAPFDNFAYPLEYAGLAVGAEDQIIVTASSDPGGAILRGAVVLALNRQGALLWTDAQAINQFGCFAVSPPVIREDGTVVVARGSRVVALSAEGSREWEFNSEKVFDASFAVTADGAVVGYQGLFPATESASRPFAVTANGTLAWGEVGGDPAQNVCLRSPNTHGPRGVALTPGGLAVIPGSKRELLAFEAQAGLADGQWSKLNRGYGNRSAAR